MDKICVNEEGKLNPEMSYVSLRHIDKIYDNNVQAVFDFNLDINKREFIVFVGPSGCGKSTTLRMIAGLEDISSGELWIDGVLANDLTPKDRSIAMVFQSYALYPHMSVYENMAFGLRIAHFPEEEIDRRVHEAARILEIEPYLNRKPKALSGGQRQRVALGRAIVRNAKVFLMDEPLSNLDAKLRIQMRSEIIKLHTALKATTIYVTHDQTEAMTMASRIVVMKDGVVQQIGTPFEIYNNPNNLFVAGFIGSPPMNFVRVSYKNEQILLSSGETIPLSEENKERIETFYKELEVSLKSEFASVKNSLLEKGVDLATLEPISDEVVSTKKSIFKRKPKIDPIVEAIKKLNKRYFAIKEQLEKLTNSSDEAREAIFAIRPEDVYDVEADYVSKIDRKFNLSLKAETAELLGHEYVIHSSFENAEFVCNVPSNRPISQGETINVVLDLSKSHIFDPYTTKKIY